MNDGLVVGILLLGAFAIAVVCFGVGRSSVADNCNDYGKVRINGQVYVCHKQ